MEDALVSSALRTASGKIAEVLLEQIGLYACAGRELEKIRKTFQSMEACLRDAESKQVANEGVRHWLSNLKAIAHDIEDVLNEWQILGLQNNDGSNDDEDNVRTCLPSPYAFFNRSVSRYMIARQIKEIRGNLDQIAVEQRLFNFSINTSSSGEATSGSSMPQTTSFMRESQIIGRDKDKEAVISTLVSGSSSGDGDGQQVHVTAIVGIGGLGKTTLAQQIYNDMKVRDHFCQAVYWVCVSDDFDVSRVTKAIIQEVKKASSTFSELNSLQHELHESLRRKRFLLVLDDVWNYDAKKWEMLQPSLTSGAQGSRILVTTRSEMVAKTMNAAYIHRLLGLSDDPSWDLFKNRAFAGWKPEEHSDREWEKVGRQIVGKCRGVPLSIEVIGSAMNSKRAMVDWQNISGSSMWSLPQVADEIFPALMLSYYNLPPNLKQCFAHCSIYQKDTRMNKDELVKLWVVQGFIPPQKNREMEVIGEEYFNDLVACSMLQQVRRFDDGGTEFQMHDLLHDLAKFIMKDESYIFVSENSHNQCPVNVRHASLFLSEDNPSIPIPSFIAKKLRTLFVHGLNENGRILDAFFHEARFLRALLFKWCKITMLPETIGELKHLRYLDLSCSNVVELPESMSHLVNLHTLNLSRCDQLKKLPRGIGRMVSLRHLQIEGTGCLECLPKGLGKISCLRSLCKFIVGGEGGCGIGELQRLNSLQGTLEIQHLERLSSSEEAEKAELLSKSDLRRLVLRMSPGSDEAILMSGRNDAEKETMENVLDGLQPHRTLIKLELHCDSGSSKLKLPRWMEDSCFSKLTELVIDGFSQCEENLLGLGKLPALKKLELWGVGVRKMGDEFYYGMNNVVGERRVAAFPKLESLSLTSMYKLEEWKLASEADDAPNVMPSLRRLVIGQCPALQVLLPPLAYGPLARVGWSSFPRLEDFTLEDSKFLSSCLPDLPNLKKFRIEKLRNATLPSWGWDRLVTLQELDIWDCDEVKSLPDGLGQLKKLRSLCIEGEELTFLPNTLAQLEALEGLIISGCQKLVSLPHSLGQLKTLKKLIICRCRALESLPDALQHLSLLELLHISGCPLLLSERCKEGGQDWRKISHIRTVFINDEFIKHP